MKASQYKAHMRGMRHKRLRAKIVGSPARPRLAVYRSNSFIYAQLIDDTTGKTVAAADSRKEKGSPLQKAQAVGAAIAQQAAAVKITEVVFDRGGFRYQGSIAALADAARAGGLTF